MRDYVFRKSWSFPGASPYQEKQMASTGKSSYKIKCLISHELKENLQQSFWKKYFWRLH